MNYHSMICQEKDEWTYQQVDLRRKFFICSHCKKQHETKKSRESQPSFPSAISKYYEKKTIFILRGLYQMSGVSDDMMGPIKQS